MKKYITIAALLVAGTAFVNAESESLTLTSPSGGVLESGNQAVGWSENYTALESWELSFTLLDASLSNAYLFSTDQADGGAAGYTLKVAEDGALMIVSNKVSFTYSESTEAGWVSAGVSVDITLKYVSTVDLAGTAVGGKFTLISGERSKEFSVTEGLSNHTQLENDSGSRFWTNSGAEKFSNISVTKLDNHVIPEPSAFGLLAGFGALALVGARRRRR